MCLYKPATLEQMGISKKTRIGWSLGEKIHLHPPTPPKMPPLYFRGTATQAEVMQEGKKHF